MSIIIYNIHITTVITGVRTSQDPDGQSHKSTTRDKTGNNKCKYF